MFTYRDELYMDYPEMRDAPLVAIGCPHNWDYCNRASTPCGKIGRENVSRNDCVACWTQKIDYKDEQGNMVTVCVESWFIHVYTKKPMCKVRVMREDGSVAFEAITKEEFYRLWALSE